MKKGDPFLLEFVAILMQTNHSWCLWSLEIDAKQVERSATSALKTTGADGGDIKDWYRGVGFRQ